MSCRPDQIKPELNRFLQMLKVVYGTFGLTYKMALSTRPEEKLGDDAMWDQAEGALQGALDETGLEWEVSSSPLHNIIVIAYCYYTCMLVGTRLARCVQWQSTSQQTKDKSREESKSLC